ncbi:MAG: molybdopterin molybdotransferase MoeA [Candidatus Heimdallarchaeota archaeon]|nr:molybdopterin molybdotransferase MoeA [Candidatus Heimdallarchaeota archaeon]
MSVRGHGFSNVLRVEEIQQILLDKAIYHGNQEKIQSIMAIDRILIDDIISNMNLPGFKRSAMDGYAVSAPDTFGASEITPITLAISGIVEIGDTETVNIAVGTVMRISTGAPLPIGADAVVKIEDCEIISDTLIDITTAVNSGTNVAKEDEDVKKGDLVLTAGTIIRPWDIAILESMGQHQIGVVKKPKISVLSTGDELVASGKVPQIGEVIDSNRPAITAWLNKFQVEIVKSEQCPDNYDLLKAKLLELAEISDLIITTGGTSVGTKDYLPEIINDIGDLWVHGCAIRPGKPIAIGMIKGPTKDTIIIALPGYPLAAFINFELFVETLISEWTKMSIPWKEKTSVKLRSKVPSKAGVRDFVRLRKVEDGAEVIRITGAGILSSLVTADYMLEIPEDTEGYAEGTEVTVRKLR